MNSIVLYHHLGMGDHFICNGLVNELSRSVDKVILICKRHYSTTVKHLYEDNLKVQIHVIEKEPDDIVKFCESSNLPLMRIGFENVNPEDFAKSFYTQLNMPSEYQYTRFSLPSNLSQSEMFLSKVKQHMGGEYIFVHDESSVGKFDLKIESRLPRFIVNKQDTNDVLDYVHTICNASEIHFINSGLYPLIVGLYYKRMIKTNKIFYHISRSVSQGGLPIFVPETFHKVQYL